MNTFLLILAGRPIVLWGIGGFKSVELGAELPKLSA